jgi:hypothetical protein
MMMINVGSCSLHPFASLARQQDHRYHAQGGMTASGPRAMGALHIGTLRMKIPPIYSENVTIVGLEGQQVEAAF